MNAQGKRLGALLPPMNVTFEPEINRWVPPGLTVHAQRMYRSRPVTGPEDLKEMLTHLDDDCHRLSFAQPDFVVYACTSGSALETGGYDTAMSDRISSAVGCPASTTSTAVAEALRHLGIRRMAVVTPYVQEINDKEMDFFRDLGFDPVSLESFLEGGSFKIPTIPQEATYEMALKADRPEADGVFISCTNLPTADIIERLEDKLGKPVVTSNQATLWLSLRHMGFDGPVPGCGQLLATPAPVAG